MKYEDIIYSRLKFLGLPPDVTNWHNLQAAYAADKLSHNRVRASLGNMTNRQVIAFVRKHGALNPAAMMCMWKLQDKMTFKDLAWCFEGFQKHHTWLVAAYMITDMTESNACELVYDRPR